MDKVFWYIKQLLPLSYLTTYSEGGSRHISYWRMWFGQQFMVQDFIVCDGCSGEKAKYNPLTVPCLGCYKNSVSKAERGGKYCADGIWDNRDAKQDGINRRVVDCPSRMVIEEA